MQCTSASTGDLSFGTDMQQRHVLHSWWPHNYNQLQLYLQQRQHAAHKWCDRLQRLHYPLRSNIVYVRYQLLIFQQLELTYRNGCNLWHGRSCS